MTEPAGEQLLSEKKKRICADLETMSHIELVALLLEWHDAFYREEKRADALNHKLQQVQRQLNAERHNEF